MNSSFTVTEEDIRSDLLDLSTISMTALRELDGTMLQQALRNVREKTAHPQVTASQSSTAERVD